MCLAQGNNAVTSVRLEHKISVLCCVHNILLALELKGTLNTHTTTVMGLIPSPIYNMTSMGCNSGTVYCNPQSGNTLYHPC